MQVWPGILKQFPSLQILDRTKSQELYFHSHQMRPEKESLWVHLLAYQQGMKLQLVKNFQQFQLLLQRLLAKKRYQILEKMNHKIRLEMKHLLLPMAKIENGVSLFVQTPK